MLDEFFIKTLQNLFEAFHWEHFIKHTFLNLLFVKSVISEKKNEIKLPVAMLLWHYQCPYFHLRTVRMAHLKLNQQYLEKINSKLISRNFHFKTQFFNMYHFLELFLAQPQLLQLQ